MSICRKRVSSFFSPHSKEEEEAFRRTPCDVSPPSRFPSNGFRVIVESKKPIKPFDFNDAVAGSPSSEAGDLAGEGMEADTGLSSCTESLGFESSEEMMSSLDDVGSVFSGKDSSPPSCSCSPSSSFSHRRRESGRRVAEKRKFPPPLTSLSENGRRNFMLKPVREDGRLEIVRVMIERPEILCASRLNGRLRLHLVQTCVRDDEDAETEAEEEENAEEEVAEERENGEKEVAEKENGEKEVAEEEEDGEKVVAEVEESGEKAVAEEDEERENEEGEGKDQWRVIAGAGLRRCYHMREMKVWNQQHRYVTSV